MYTLSNWIANSINVESNTPFTYKGRQWMPALFDTPKRKRLWKMSRQVGKSTGGAGEGMGRGAKIENFKILYVAPVKDQAEKFSKNRLDPIIENSPVIKSQIGTPNNVYEKKFKKGGKYYLNWAKHRPDNIRGVTADMVHYDEIQDQDLQEIEPVINEVCFTSQEYNLRLYTGTPKSFVNDIELKWRKSDQREWVVRCGHHEPAKWMQVGIRNIGKKGPICHHCGNLLDVSDGVWVKHGKGDIAGFHVHQLNLKISHMIQRDGSWEIHPPSWNEILDKLENYPRWRFKNEVLGLSADTAETPLTIAHLRAISREDVEVERNPKAKYMGHEMYAGIDWGHGDAATVLVIGQMIEGTFRILFLKKYTGQQCEKSYCIPDMADIIRNYRVSRIHCDHGGGFGLNSDMAEIFDDKVTTNVWSASAKAADKTWKTKKVSIPRLTLNRPNAISEFIGEIRKQRVEVPRWSEFHERFSSDFLNIRKEIDVEKDKIRYLKADHDDAFQAAIYAWIIARVSQSSTALH